MNEFIRKSTVCDAELAEFAATCEICGYQGVYAEMHHDFTQDVIMCMDHVGGPTVPEMVKLFNKINDDCMRAQEDSIPFTDVEYYAEQIENIFGVPEIRAYELATQLSKENSMLKIEGFNHVTAAGIAQLWQYFQMKGTIDMLYDMKPMDKINELMQSENFDMDAHIKTNYGDADYDEVVADMIDELLETIITLEYCFIYDVYSIDFRDKSIKHLDTIPVCDEWNPNVYLPIAKPELFEFHDIHNEFAKFCADKCLEGYEIQACVVTGESIDEDGNGYVSQSFEWLITGAADFNTLHHIIDLLTEDCEYHNLKVIAQLKK
jgi:hypothetical protein